MGYRTFSLQQRNLPHAEVQMSHTEEVYIQCADCNKVYTLEDQASLSIAYGFKKNHICSSFRHISKNDIPKNIYNTYNCPIVVLGPNNVKSITNE